jgi:hypothetical protein
LQNATILNSKLVAYIQNEAQKKGRKGKLGIIVVDALEKALADAVLDYSLHQHKLVRGDWANVPHVSPSTYPDPPKESKLIYTEIIQRHHQKTPYGANLLPNEDLELWDKLVPSQKAGYPMLTLKGHADSEQHGKDLRNVYGQLLQFLPKDDISCVQFAVTSNPLTTQVLSSLIKGLFPTVASYQHEAVTDSLAPFFPSPKAELSRARDKEQNLQRWNDHETELTRLFDAIDQVTSIPPNAEDWHISADHYFDNFSAKMSHGIALPEAITDEQLQEIRRLGDTDYQMLYGNQESCVLSYWMYVEEMLQRLEKAGNSKLLYRHNIAHDGSLSRLMGILRDSNLNWPGMGTEIVFEVWETQAGARFVHVLKNGEIMTSEGRWKNMENIDLVEFVAYHRSVIID